MVIETNQANYIMGLRMLLLLLAPSWLCGCFLVSTLPHLHTSINMLNEKCVYAWITHPPWKPYNVFYWLLNFYNLCPQTISYEWHNSMNGNIVKSTFQSSCSCSV